jgi:hypothetical protein
MEIKVSCFEVHINEEDELGYNWANLRINVPATDGPKGSVLLGEIMVRVPKSVTNLDDIEKNAVEEVRKIFSHFSDAHFRAES